MAKYNKITAELAEKLKAIVGEDRFYFDGSIPEDYCHDEMPIYGKRFPEAVCEVESTEEVAAIMKLCNENLIPVTPRGAGTGLVGGAVALNGGVIICTARMDKILGYDMKNLCVHTQVGVRLCDLAADAQAHGLFYPPDPGEKTATVGGNVSIMKLGKTVCKTSSGYSLLHLICGSEGTLGIITELTLKLIPAPACDVSLILPFTELADAIASVPSIKLANLDPQSIEFMDADIVKSSAAFTGNAIFPTEVGGKAVGACILVTLVGNSEDELYLKMEKLGEVAEKVGAMDVLVVDTPSLKKEVWAARSSFLTAIEADTKLLDEMDVVVPVDRIAEFLVYVREVGAEQGIKIRNFGHAGDGNLHIYCCSNTMTREEFIPKVKVIMDKCYAKCTEFEGQVSGEHAIGHAKKEYLKESVGEAAFNLMAQIKQVFDPNMILNVGKVCTYTDDGE